VKKERKHYTAKGKIAILSRHLLEQELILDSDSQPGSCVRIRPNIVFFKEKEQ